MQHYHYQACQKHEKLLQLSTNVRKVRYETITNLSAWVEGNFRSTSDFNSHHSSQLYHIYRKKLVLINSQQNQNGKLKTLYEGRRLYLVEVSVRDIGELFF